MKKILMSLLTIAIVSALITGGTMAYFSDVETSGENAFTAGTIDIAIDHENPWTGSFTIEDMKPCDTGYITFWIKNVGTNPVVVWKHIKDVECNGGEQLYTGEDGLTASSEPEWQVDPGDFKNNIAKWIWYDLWVWVYVPGGHGQPSEEDLGDPAGSGWWQTIFDEDDVTIKDIKSEHILLGMIPVGAKMAVVQSYHLDADVGNKYQGDRMNFTIEIYGEQQTGSLTLEDKAGDDWVIQHDGPSATLTYNNTGPTFDYNLTADGLAAGNYSLIYYADPWPGSNGCLIGGPWTASSSLDVSGSVDLGMDLPAPGDYNFDYGAKIWLVLSSDYSTTTSGDSGQMTGWNPGDYLFETALITYDDTDD